MSETKASHGLCPGVSKSKTQLDNKNQAIGYEKKNMILFGITFVTNHILVAGNRKRSVARVGKLQSKRFSRHPWLQI